MDNSDAIKRRCACLKVATFKCGCKTEVQYLCFDCTQSHLYLKLPHKLESISININESPKAALITFLINNLNSLNIIEESILTEIQKSILKIQEHSDIIFKDISNLQKKLKSLLLTIISLPKNTNEFNIKEILTQFSQEKIKEMSTWKLFSLNFNTEMFDIPWVTYENNYEKYFISENPVQKSMITPKPPYAAERKANLEEVKIVENSEIIAKLEPVMFCEENHELVWSYTALLENFIRKNFKKIQCSLCGKRFAKPCWHCSKCAFDVCEECGNRQGFKSPKLVCDNNHELSWKCTVVAKYSKKSISSTINCSLCGNVFFTPSWHCAKCNYDLCRTCANLFNAFPIELKNKCIFNHTLKQEMHNGQTYCKDCSKKIIRIGLSCNICNYHICLNCNSAHNLEIPQDPSLSCQNGHLLRWRPPKSFRCNSCGSSFQSNSFHCLACDFDICYECADYIEDVNREGIKRYDKNGHEFEIGYVRYSGKTLYEFYCKFCNLKLPGNCVIFSCTQCNVFMCIKCFRNNEGRAIRPSSANTLCIRRP